MKKYGILTLILLIAVFVCPMTVFIGDEKSENEETTLNETTRKYDYNSVAVVNPADDSVTEMSIRDYCIGAVAAEMPASYNTEALKAQALVCLTYYYYVQNHKDNPDGYITSDASAFQGYISVDEMKEKWGDGFDTYYKKTTAAVDSVLDYVITYNGEVIDAVFHAISPGKTESAKEVWGKDIPYLKTVDSKGDKYASGYSNSLVFSSERVIEAVKNLDGVKINSDSENIFTDTVKNSNGRVVKVNIGGQTVTGDDVRELFGLRSSYFDISYDNGYYTFKTAGYGHAVGMSQYGANYMAGEGADYKEIIRHYYPGVQIEKKQGDVKKVQNA